MLHTQERLMSGESLKDLNEKLGIKITYNDEMSLCILNYDQIESKPQNHEVVIECRNLILEVGSWTLVSKSFNRFFNYGQYNLDYENFNWNNFFIQEKIDGSLMSLFHFNGKWMVTTRGSFANLLCGESGKTWSELFFSVISEETVNKVCIPGTSYIFEFCGPWNKVVAPHKENKLFLLSAFQSENELPLEAVDEIANKLVVNRPKVYNFSCMEEILAYIETQINDNPTWEGVIICDDKRRRWKIKNPGYLALHRLANNGNGFTIKSLIPFILNGDEEEAMVYIHRYFNEIIPYFIECKELIDSELAKLMSLWDEVKTIESQKDFALAVVPKTKFSTVLFKARKDNLHPKDVWKNSEDLILKILFNK